MVSKAALACCLIVLAWPSASWGCSCPESHADLATQLRAALRDSKVVYRGRVLTRKKTFFTSRDVASVRVLEVFKGAVKVGDELELPAGGRGDCTIYFFGGREYLMYGRDEDPEEIYMCSRTRAVESGDLELEWLRSGVPPPPPAAVQRETVRCTPCSVERVTSALVPVLTPGAYDPGLDDLQSLEALRVARPFWTSNNFGPDPSQRRAVGLGWQGTDGGTLRLRAFELIQTPHRSIDETCHQRVARRWCEKLEPVGHRSRGELAVRCVNPQAPEELCDEAKSRESAWGPLERPAVARCEWENPEWPTCELHPTTDGLDAGSPGTPLLRCRPSRWSDAQSCHLVMKPGPVEPKRPVELPLEY